MPGGGRPQPPPAPNIGQATAEGIEAYVEALPEIIDIQTAYQPQLTTAGIRSGREQFLSAQDVLAEGMRRYGDDIIEESLNLERKYGPEVAKAYIQNMRSAAPGYFDIRDKYETAIQEDLALGAELSPEQQRVVQQATRAGQSARGNIRGTAPTAQEVMRTFMASEGLRDKRLGRAYQYAATPAPGVTTGTAPTAMGVYRGNPAPQFTGGPTMTPSQGLGFGQQAAQQAQQLYGQQYGAYQQAASNYVSPWATAAGLGIGAAGIFGLCWVAREVYGEDNPDWMIFRDWLLTKAPEKLRGWYAENGEEYAKEIQDRPDLKKALKSFMDRKVNFMKEVQYAN